MQLLIAWNTPPTILFISTGLTKLTSILGFTTWAAYRLWFRPCYIAVLCTSGRVPWYSSVSHTYHCANIRNSLNSWKRTSRSILLYNKEHALHISDSYCDGTIMWSQLWIVLALLLIHVFSKYNKYGWNCIKKRIEQYFLNWPQLIGIFILIYFKLLWCI